MTKEHVEELYNTLKIYNQIKNIQEDMDNGYWIKIISGNGNAYNPPDDRYQKMMDYLNNEQTHFDELIEKC